MATTGTTEDGTAPVSFGGSGGDEAIAIPLVAETLDVQKRIMMTGGARVTKTVLEHEEIVDEALRHEEVSVERVPINQWVSEAPASRQEGDTLIVPVLEEVLVVEKRLRLKEEVRITRTQHQVHQPQSVVLRSEEVAIERLAPQDEPQAR